MSEWMEMTCSPRATMTLAIIASIALWAASPAAAQAPISTAEQAPMNVYDLADYRLTSEVFEQFVQASGRVAEITRQDSAFTYAPLFTKDVALDGDAVVMAS